MAGGTVALGAARPGPLASSFSQRHARPSPAPCDPPANPSPAAALSVSALLSTQAPGTPRLHCGGQGCGPWGFERKHRVPRGPPEPQRGVRPSGGGRRGGAPGAEGQGAGEEGDARLAPGAACSASPGILLLQSGTPPCHRLSYCPPHPADIVTSCLLLACLPRSPPGKKSSLPDSQLLPLCFPESCPFHVSALAPPLFPGHKSMVCHEATFSARASRREEGQRGGSSALGPWAGKHSGGTWGRSEPLLLKELIGERHTHHQHSTTGWPDHTEQALVWGGGRAVVPPLRCPALHRSRRL